MGARGADVDVVLPKVALTMAAALIEQWYCKVGDNIEAGTPLFSMETDKATVDVESPATGIVSAILHKPGEMVSAGEVVAIIEVANSSHQRSRAIASAEREVAPAAAELAELLGIDLARVGGTGPGGRVLEADVIKASAQATTTPAAIRSPQPQEPRSVPAQISKARQAGLHLTERMAEVPAFYVTRTLDFSNVLDSMRDQQITVTDVITVASARALKVVPACHGRILEGRVHTYLESRIGILLRSGDALVPIVFPDPSSQAPSAVRAKRKQLVAQLEAGHIDPENLWWPTFVISNLGRYGVESFTAVLFPETAVTLALASLSEEDSKPRVLKAVLTCDHRIVDGIDAATFMAELASQIEIVAREEQREA